MYEKQKPMLLSYPLGLAGLVWPPYAVLDHWFADESWARALIATLVIGVVASLLGRGVLRAERAGFLGAQVAMTTGVTVSGTLFGTIIALCLLPFTGQAGLIPAAVLLVLICSSVNQAVDYGVTGFYFSGTRKNGNAFLFSVGESPEEL